MNFESFLYYTHSWIQAIQFLLFLWFTAWAVSRAVDFCRAGMERVRRLEARERASEREGER
jgi:hypothetical protein